MERGGEKRGRELESGRGRKGGKEGVRERVRKDEVEKERYTTAHMHTLPLSPFSGPLCPLQQLFLQNLGRNLLRSFPFWFLSQRTRDLREEGDRKR